MYMELRAWAAARPRQRRRQHPLAVLVLCCALAAVHHRPVGQQWRWAAHAAGLPSKCDPVCAGRGTCNEELGRWVGAVGVGGSGTVCG